MSERFLITEGGEDEKRTGLLIVCVAGGNRLRELGLSEDEIEPLQENEFRMAMSFLSSYSVRTSVYGSLVSVGVSVSGLKGGRPPVDQKVPGVGKVKPKANCVSVNQERPGQRLLSSPYAPKYEHTEISLATGLGQGLVV